MDMVKKTGQMEPHMKEDINLVKKKAKVHSFGVMEPHIQGYLKIIIFMDMENILGLISANIKEIGN